MRSWAEKGFGVGTGGTLRRRDALIPAGPAWSSRIAGGASPGSARHPGPPDWPAGLARLIGATGRAPDSRRTPPPRRPRSKARRPAPCTLVYGNRRERQIACRAELDALDRRPGFEIVHVLGEPPPGWTGATGLIDANLLRHQFGDRSDRAFMLCGPPGMPECVGPAPIAMGVPSGRILWGQFV